MRIKISSTGSTGQKFIVFFFAIFIAFLIIQEIRFSFSFLILTATVCYLLIFTSLLVKAYYNPDLGFTDQSISFKRFSRPREEITFENIMAIERNWTTRYDTWVMGRRYDYKIWYFDEKGKRRKIDFYFKKRDKRKFNEMITRIRSVNKNFETNQYF